MKKEHNPYYPSEEDNISYNKNINDNNNNQDNKSSNSKSDRKISKDKYALAAILTILIFSLGLTLGFLFEDHRYNLVEEVNMEQEVKYSSLQLQFLFLDAFSNENNCPILSATLKEAVKDLSDSLNEVIAYEEENQGSSTRKVSIMRRYLLDNLRYWLLATESKRKCDLNIVPILYFYTPDCPSCPNQGTILSYFKKLFGEQVLVFPINLDLKGEEPMVDIITSQYEITKYPTLIIDNKKYEGVLRSEQLQEIICDSIGNVPQCE